MRNPLLNKWFIAAFLLLSTLAGGGYGLYLYVNERLAQLEKSNAPSQESVGIVAQQKGRVWSELNSSKRLLAVGSPIYQGDRIITGRHARLILKMSDEAIISVGEDTELVVQDYQYTSPAKLAETQAKGAAPPPSNRGLLELTRGAMKAVTGALGRMEERPFAVKTLVATMGVRGTELWGRLSYEKNEVTGDETPKLDHICMAPTCTVKNDAGEQVAEKANLATQVESKRKAPSKPEPANREMLARAHLSTMVPPKLPPEMVQQVSAKLIAMFQESGKADSPEAAARMVEAALERVVEKIEWNAAEKAVMELLDKKSKVTPAELDAQLKKELSAADYDKYQKAQLEKEAGLNSLQQEQERRLQEDLSADKAKQVGQILENQRKAEQELQKNVQARLEELTDPDKASKISALREKEKQQQQALDDQLNKDLSSLLSKDMADKLQRLEEKYGTSKPEKLEEFLRTQITDEQTFLKVKEALESNRAAEADLSQKTASTLASLVADEQTLASMQQLFRQEEVKLAAMEQLAENSLKEVAGRNFEELKATLDEFDARRAEITQKAENALSSELRERIDTVQSSLGQEGISAGEIQQLMESGFPAEELGQVVDQSLEQVSTVMVELLARNPDATTEDIFNAVERFLATEPEWKEEAPIEPTREETEALGNVEDTDVLEEMEVAEEDVSGTGVDSDTVEQIPVPPTAPVAEEGSSAALEAKTATTEAPKEDVETETPDTAAEQTTAAPLGASKLMLDYAKDKNTGLSLGGVFENSAANTIVGQIQTNSSIDGDAYTFEFDNPFGSAAGRFFISNDIVYVKDGTLLNYEANSDHTITLKATNNANRSFTYDITIPVLDDNEAPTDMALKDISGGSRASVVENSANDTLVGTITSKDPDKKDTAVYTLNDDASGRFKVSGDKILVADKSKLNYEANASHYITLRVTDKGGLTYDERFLIYVTDINEPPSAITLSNSSLSETSGAGTLVGTFTVTDEDAGDTHTLTFTTNAALNQKNADGRFELNASNLNFTNALPINFEGDYSFIIEIQAMDAGGLSLTKEFTISVTDVNEAPTSIGLTMDVTHTSGALPENAPNGTVVGKLATTDPDNGDTRSTDDTHIYTFTSTGDAANGIFAISGDNIVVADNSDLTDEITGSKYTVYVTVTDQGTTAPVNQSSRIAIDINMRSFDCKYIPDSPTVAMMSATGRATYMTALGNLAKAAQGATITLSNEDLENLIVSKVGQQLDSFVLTDAVEKFDVMMRETTEQTFVDVYTQVNLGGAASGLYGKLAGLNPVGQSFLGKVDEVFQTLAPYAYSGEYRACVRLRVIPSINAGTGIISFDQANSTVEVHHDILLVPDVVLGVDDAIQHYNDYFADLAPLRFFTTQDSYPPFHTLYDVSRDVSPTSGARDLEKTMRRGINDAGGTPPSYVAQGYDRKTAESSQSIPFSKNIDYYFPGLIDTVTIDTGVATLKRR